jgi:hypothetical protein
MNWKALFAAFALLAVAAAACGSDPCTKAADQLAACAPATSMGGSSTTMTTACDDFALCLANCVNDATCTQISGNAPAFTQCRAACQGK